MKSSKREPLSAYELECLEWVFKICRMGVEDFTDNDLARAVILRDLADLKKRTFEQVTP